MGREATGYDADALARFSCSLGAPFEDEVETYVRRRALAAAEHARKTGGSYRLLVFEADRRLVGVTAHQAVELRLPEAKPLAVVKLVVLAVELNWQGTRLATGASIADAVLAATVAHGRATHERTMFCGIVARGNFRSLRVCERNGLTTQLEYGPDHLCLLGTFK